MKKYRKKPVVIEAMTWDELVQYAINKGAPVVMDGLPWSFDINGRPVTHDAQGGYNRYLITTLEGQMEMTRDDMCIIGIKGEAYPCKKDIFDATYEIVEG